MDIQGTIKGNKVIEIIINGYKISCNVDLKDWDMVQSLLEKLISLGVFKLNIEDLIKDFIKKLKINEKRLISILSIDQFISIEELKGKLGMKGRQIAGILANITRKARETKLVSDNESIYESKWEKDQVFYKLKKNQYTIEILNMLKSGEKHD
jgi:hypothetical protein